MLSGPVVGEFALLDRLIASDELRSAPIDVAVLSRDDACGAAYAADPLVWHGAFPLPTVEAMAAMVATINGAGSLGALPLLWVHGVDDALVPIDGSRIGIERLRGDDVRQARVSGRAPRGVQRDQLGRGARRRDRLHRRLRAAPKPRPT